VTVKDNKILAKIKFADNSTKEEDLGQFEFSEGEKKSLSLTQQLKNDLLNKPNMTPKDKK
jgi:hypothetical protein